MSTTDSTTTIESSCSTEDRALAYLALINYLSFDMEPQRLGESVEKWAGYMADQEISKRALAVTLGVVGSVCPFISLVRACFTLGIAVSDVTEIAA